MKPLKGDDEPIARSTPTGRVETDPVVVIGPPRGVSVSELREYWDYRELLHILSVRDLSVRYRQTIFGVGWALLQPLSMVITFTLVFRHFAKVSTENIPYPVFALAGLLPWNGFVQGVTRVGMSLVSNAHLIGKVYFPRLIIPVSSIVVPLVDFFVALFLLFGLMLWYGIDPSGRWAAIPFLMAATAMVALSIGVWLAVLNVHFRDVGHVIPIALQILLFLTPVAYPSTLVPDRWRAVYELNPMAVVIEGFRWSLLGSPAPSGFAIAVSTTGVLAVLIAGLHFFRRTEDTLVDVI